MAGQSNKRKGGNKHFLNVRRQDRKYKRHRVNSISGESRYSRPAAESGKCGSSFCSRSTGCQPWK